ncbi:MAG: glycosyltransferase [Acidobacteria bacterium]|jgi:glycosyltransferase involved in cell wall biosynthesis|nr:glycosyltransferase [Acidobacteriota bacterium]
MKEKPIISIVTVVFNGAKYLEQAIQSVVSQDYQNIEYIVIDGGSTDGSVDIIRKYSDKIAYWVSEPDQGIFHAMNKGIKKATGDYIGILNADDWYEPGIIQKVAEMSEAKDEFERSVFYCDYYRYDEELNEIGKVKRCSTLEYWKGMSVLHQSMFIGRGVYEQLGDYDLKYRLAADYDFLLRMADAGVEFEKIDIHGVNFRRGGESTMRMRESIREASHINGQYFGYLSKKHFSFILNNHIPSVLGSLKLMSYKYLGRNKTARLRKLWKRIKRT